MTSEPTSTAAPEKPANLNKPMRAFVKRNGKKLVRKIAAFQSKQSKVPDTPKIDNSYFPFLETIANEWETIRDEAQAVLKFREDIPGFQDPFWRQGTIFRPIRA